MSRAVTHMGVAYPTYNMSGRACDGVVGGTPSASTGALLESTSVLSGESRSKVRGAYIPREEQHSNNNNKLFGNGRRASCVVYRVLQSGCGKLQCVSVCKQGGALRVVLQYSRPSMCGWSSDKRQKC